MTNNAQHFIQTAQVLRDMGYEEINLNLGCPSAPVVSRRRGSGLLAFPEDLDRLLGEIFDGIDIKVSVKTRIGSEEMCIRDRCIWQIKSRYSAVSS